MRSILILYYNVLVELLLLHNVYTCSIVMHAPSGVYDMVIYKIRPCWPLSVQCLHKHESDEINIHEISVCSMATDKQLRHTRDPRWLHP